MKFLNKYIATILFVLSIVYITTSFLLPSYPHVPVDSDFFPLILGFLLLFLSVILFFTKDSEKYSLYVPKGDLLALLGVAFLIFLYIFLLEILGFLIVTAAFIYICSLFLGYRNHVVSVIVALVFPVSIYFLFTEFLMISLPSGILPF
ncbi:tripartite tricarboxylate transporter TctB family protein [Salicibibacter kimchii]|uniref:Tripartite tricarboxylate transporter TctB family protein n=1 Tax=Salicibibacter kimchii TaxID=2099786 RepID=A0A345BWF5_9BACI|nr:tripartite tricarboxylate transporter TctB family protein [Salicibibacter kimchii]AXF55286.1 tripartite tricarboxylate transporter TctB family protein [Salicibibacter kimchii]